MLGFTLCFTQCFSMSMLQYFVLKWGNASMSGQIAVGQRAQKTDHIVDFLF